MAVISKRWIMLGGAAAACAAVAAAALTLRLGTDREGIGRAAIGEARADSLTVALAPPVTDRIHGARSAAGRPIVVLDAGHGGHDPGAASVSGEVLEKDLTLDLAGAVRDELVKRGRVRVAMTRERDTYLTLDERAAVARRLGASLFLSLHMDSAPNPLARGATVYSLSDVPSDADTARFAAKENAQADEISAGAEPVQALLSELELRSRMTASAELAERMVRRSAGRIDLRPEPHRFAAFHVLRSAGTAAILFEAGYLSNVEDEAMLRSRESRQRMVLALAQAIEADVAARSQR